MNFRPGRFLVRGAAAGIVLAPLTALWAPVGWLLFSWMMALLYLAARDWRELRQDLTQLRLHHAFPVQAARGRHFKLQIDLENTGSSTLAGELRAGLPPAAIPSWWQVDFTLQPAQRLQFSMDICLPTRGAYAIGPYWARLRGRSGCLELQQSIAVTGEIRIMPESAVESGDIHKKAGDNLLQLERQRRAWRGGEGYEFDTLSIYREGDDIRRLDWRATARHGKPMVRRYRVEQHRDILLLLDSGRLMGAQVQGESKLDCAVDAAVRLSRVALARGDRCGLGVFDHEVRGYLPPQLGPRAYHMLLNQLYNLQSRWQETNFSGMFAMLQFRQIKRALLIIISDLTDLDTTGQFRSALATLAKRHLVLFVALQTPLLEGCLAAPAASFDDLSRQAVALRLMREREAALHSLHGAGVQVLDVQPRELGLPLVNRYIELRERNLL